MFRKPTFRKHMFRFRYSSKPAIWRGPSTGTSPDSRAEPEKRTYEPRY
jgi:hypothetical protein